LRAKTQIFEIFFIPFLISAYVISLLEKSLNFQSNTQVRPIMEGRCFLPSGEKRQILNPNIEILNNDRNTNVQIVKTFCFGHFNFVHLDLFGN